MNSLTAMQRFARARAKALGVLADPACAASSGAVFLVMLRTNSLRSSASYAASFLLKSSVSASEL